MRIIGILVASITLAVLAIPAQAFETFIPLGTGYSTSVSKDPAIESERQRIIEQADIYETEIYNKQLQERILQSRSSAFFIDAAAFSSDRSIDY
jgi:hypothetical protein